MGRGHRPRILRGAAAWVQPGHTSHLHTRWAHTQGPQEQWSWLVGTLGPLAAIHFPRGGCPLFRVGTLRLPPGVCVWGAACFRLHPLLAPPSSRPRPGQVGCSRCSPRPVSDVPGAPGATCKRPNPAGSPGTLPRTKKSLAFLSEGSARRHPAPRRDGDLGPTRQEP